MTRLHISFSLDVPDTCNGIPIEDKVFFTEAFVEHQFQHGLNGLCGSSESRVSNLKVREI